MVLLAYNYGMKTVFEKTLKEIEESLLEQKLRDVAPGDELGAKRAAMIAKDQAADFYRVVAPEGQEL